MQNDVILDAGGVEIRLEGDREKFAPSERIVHHRKRGAEATHSQRRAGPATGGSRRGASGAQLFEPVIAAIKANAAALLEILVLSESTGFRTVSGELTQEPAIIVVTKPGEQVGPVPPSVGSILVEVRTASAQEMVEGLAPLSAWEGVVTEAVPQIAYTPPVPPPALEEAQVRNITCHVGPDSGWTTLKPFLDGTTTSLTVAMYRVLRRSYR